MKTAQLVWDWPTRTFHWLLALSFAGAYITAETEYYRDWHVALGYVFGGLLVFRLVWGLVGTRYARFANFAYSPKALISYLQSLLQKPLHYVGHNPAGAWAIFLLLVLGLSIAMSGIGLYWELGGDEWAEEFFEEIHELSANLMLAVIGVHILGVIISSVLHKENLPRAMLTGHKTIEENEKISHSYPLLGLAMVLTVVGFMLWYLQN